uniref:RNA-guided endonuclease IscB n=1 Tax=Parasutterella excrementihominis TaxID=487175 RepID=UPI003FEEDBF2
MRVLVWNKRGKPLMPCSPAKARLLPKERNAIVVRRTPFTVQLTIATGETKQPVSLGVDAGYKHVGLSASTEKAELYASEIELRQDITDLLSARRELRRARRNRKTRYRGPRFDNRIRTKRKEWFAPSVENRINAHLSRIEKVLRLLPVTTITVETASFDTQLLKNPDISGKEYQEGEQ